MANPEDLGRYRLKRLLGRGALGEVWEARDQDHEGGKVAVKIMHAADEELAFARSAFAREARLASLVRHPHVVVVHDAGEAAGTSFMVMDMVEGTSLRKLIGDRSTHLSERLRWLREIGDGLSAMHQAGVVHRDLKPENVIVRPDRTACVVDLGIAKWTKFDLGGVRDPMDVVEELDAQLPKTDYVPPETAEESIYDELGDQYAWGVLAYEVLTGTVPNGASPPLTERDEVPARVAAAVERARSKRREDRWDAMELLLEELVEPTTSAALVAGRSTKENETPEASVAPPPAADGVEPAKDMAKARSRRRSPHVLAVAAVLVLLGALIVAAALR